MVLQKVKSIKMSESNYMHHTPPLAQRPQEASTPSPVSCKITHKDIYLLVKFKNTSHRLLFLDPSLAYQNPSLALPLRR